MNEQPKQKFYKRWWFVFIAGIALGAVIAVIAIGLFYKIQIMQAEKQIKGVPPLAYFELRELVTDSNGRYVSENPTGLDSRYIQGASIYTAKGSRPVVAINLNNQGEQMLVDITARDIGKQLAVYINGEMLSKIDVTQKAKGDESLFLAESQNLSDKEKDILAGGINAGKGLTRVQN